jgi:hypothetical protein
MRCSHLRVQEVLERQLDRIIGVITENNIVGEGGGCSTGSNVVTSRLLHYY